MYREKVFEKYGGRCAYCGISLNIKSFHVDHIKPKYRGWTNEELIKFNKEKGRDNVDNYNPSCISCNSSKSTFEIEKWREQLKLKQTRIKRDSAQFRILERFGLVECKDVEVVFYFEIYGKG